MITANSDANNINEKEIASIMHPYALEIDHNMAYE